jgi:hypothetical protein
VNPVPGTVRTIVVEWVTEPSVPVIETLYVPAGVLACEVKFTVTLPLALRDEGEKFAFTPDGSPLALRETLPVRLPANVTMIVLVGFVFGGREIAAGDAEMVKFGSAVTLKVILEVSVVEPLVPVTVTVAVPTVAVPVAVKVSVLPPDPVTDAG